METKLSPTAAAGSSHDSPTQLRGGKGRWGLRGAPLSLGGEHLETNASKRVVSHCVPRTLESPTDLGRRPLGRSSGLLTR